MVQRALTAAVALLGIAGMSWSVQAASGNAKASVDAWHGMDTCNKKAFQLFPDYTPEQVAKRDAYVRKCLAERNLPTRDALGAKQ